MNVTDACVLFERYGVTVPLGAGTDFAQKAAEIIASLEAQGLGTESMIRFKDLTDKDVLIVRSEDMTEDAMNHFRKTVRRWCEKDINVMVIGNDDDIERCSPVVAAHIVRRLLPLMTENTRAALLQEFCIECGTGPEKPDPCLKEE